MAAGSKSLVNGVWTDNGLLARDAQGRFLRATTPFRNWITPDGSPGPSGIGGYAPERGRYLLYVSLACPWAHRTLIYRAIKGLAPFIDVAVTHWTLGEDGWTFAPGEGVTSDPLFGARFLREVYVGVKPDVTGRVSVPLLVDKKTRTAVSNESAEIIRMMNSAFDGVGATSGDYYPEALRAEIDALNQRIYDTVNNGVYKCGFAGTQAAYDEAVAELFATLDELEKRLATRRFLIGDTPTEADWRLLPTLLRFDAVYVGLFKCNVRRIADYPKLFAYLKTLARWPGVAATVNFGHIKRHYYGLTFVNPLGIVPAGPQSIDEILSVS